MQTIGVEGGLKLPQKLFKSVNSLDPEYIKEMLV